MSIAALEELGAPGASHATLVKSTESWRAGLGVAVFPQSLVPDDLVRASSRFELPEMGIVDFTLLSNLQPFGRQSLLLAPQLSPCC